MDGAVVSRDSRSDSDDEIFHPGGAYTPRWCDVESRLHFTSCGSLSSDGGDVDFDYDGGKHGCRFKRQHSIVDGLLFEIYDRWHGSLRDSFDSDTLTECSSTSEIFYRHSFGSSGRSHSISRQFQRAFLENQSISQLQKMVSDLQRSIGQSSHRLIRQLKRRDRRIAKSHRNCDVVTAILQAASLKRRIDTRMRFSIDPPMGESAFDQWKDAMRAVARLPMGIPNEFRKKVWLNLADNHISELKVDWEKTVRFTFNERSNPDDDKLGLQIVKDLHRTGCTNFSGHDNDEERAVLKRVLLAYARWNKRVGYCQGFNVIAALLLDVMNRKEDDALKVMIYLIDHVLPDSYFTNNLRALSVDMAVFRDLLKLALPTLSNHLDHLQHAAQDVTTGACYEPPLTNVFTMQWFLTLFATCLPKNIVLRVWDSILLEGSEVLLRTALTIWGKLSRRIMGVSSADEFYTLMGDLSAEMMEGRMFNGDSVIKSIYSLSPFPFPQIKELRERYTYNIRPFTSTNTATSTSKKSRVSKNILYSDEDELDDEDIEAIACFPGFTPVHMKKGADSDGGSGSMADISVLGPGVYGATSDNMGAEQSAVYMERMSTDITALQKQYEKLRQRQTQAHIIISAATARSCNKKPKPTALVPRIESPLAMNHLFVGKNSGGSRNRLVAEGPRIVPMFPRGTHFTKHLQALDRASWKLLKDKNNSRCGKSNMMNRSPPVESETSIVQDNTEADILDEDVQEDSSQQESVSQVISTQADSDQLDVQEEVVDNCSALQTSVTVTAVQNENSPPDDGEDSEMCQNCSELCAETQDNHEQTAVEHSKTFQQSVNVEQNTVEHSKTFQQSVNVEQNTVEHSKTFQQSVTIDDSSTNPDLYSPSECFLHENSNTNCSAILESNSSFLHESVERLPSLEEGDSAVLNSDPEMLEVKTDCATVQSSKLSLSITKNRTTSSDSDGVPSPRWTPIVSDVTSPNPSRTQSISDHNSVTSPNPSPRWTPIVSDVTSPNPSRTQSISDHNSVTSPNPSPRWTANVSDYNSLTSPRWMPSVSSPNTNQLESQLVTKFVYIASKQHGNHTVSSSSSVPSPATSPTSPMTSSPVKSNKPFFPFPVKHVNQNRAKNGLKLGLYNPSTVACADTSKLKQGNGFFKARNGWS